MEESTFGGCNTLGLITVDDTFSACNDLRQVDLGKGELHETTFAVVGGIERRYK